MREADINTKVFEIISSVPEGQFVFIENIENGVSNWSKDAVEYLGLPGDSVANTKAIMLSMTHPDDRDRLQKEFDEVFEQQKEAFYLNFQIRNSRLEYVPCTCKGKIIFGEGGKALVFTGSLTIHKGEEENDAVTEILSINEMLLEIFECKTLEEFLELTHGSFSGMVHPEDYARVSKQIAQQISENTSNLDFVKYRIITKNGKIKNVRDYGHLVHNGSDVDLYYVFVVEERE